MDAAPLADPVAGLLAVAGLPAGGANVLTGAVYAVLLLAGLVLGLGFVVRAVLTAHVWEPRIRRVLWRPWPDREGPVLVLLLLLAHAVFLTGYAQATAGRAAPPGPPSGLLMVLQSLLFQGLVVVFVGGVLVRRGISLRAAFGIARHDIGRRIRQGLGMYIVSVPPVIVCLLLTRVALQGMGLEAKPQTVIRFFTADYALALRVYFLFVGVVAAPLAEEVLFRGILLPWLGRRVGPVVAAVAVSILFAALHFNLASFPALTAFGLVLAIAYYRSGALLVPITAHALFNAVNLALLYAKESAT